MFNRVTINWVQGEHVFALNLGELRALQESCDAGPELVLARLTSGAWRVDDVVEVLRLGLIGAGMPASQAGPLVAKACAQVPLLQLRTPASAVLSAALAGDAKDMPGKPAGVSPPAGSSPASTEQAP